MLQASVQEIYKMADIFILLHAIIMDHMSCFCLCTDATFTCGFMDLPTQKLLMCLFSIDFFNTNLFFLYTFHLHGK